jgi:hypothetical protein
MGALAEVTKRTLGISKKGGNIHLLFYPINVY